MRLDVPAQANSATQRKNLGCQPTRRALDREALAQHVADNIDHFMGPVAQNFVRAIEASSDSARHNLSAAQQSITASKEITAKADKLDQESRALASIASRLEERDTRSKWDWVTLAAGMVVAAGLAGGGAFFAAKASIEKDDFQRSIQLIAQDDDAGWCTRYAAGQVITGQSGAKFCAIHMPEYVEPEQAE